ncbi:hypothetical protein IEO21_05492 [Rhodonia placenta]|uniref:NAD(P)-binding protein n=1 Tax=Rhodonia placenta TaxID=104341 RepID=A0A8H7U286_9APHY|nr:hypothetical protein IEO21_05492 [Postia placenta]
MVVFSDAITLVGLLSLASLSYRFSSTVWLYLLRPSTVHHYLHGPSPYALVTGASDGIGKATALELARKGFNLILHGRNEEKVRKVASEIRAQGSRDVRYFIADAAQGGHDFANLVQPYKDLNITLLINNVGGTHMHGERIDGVPESHLRDTVNWSDMFGLFLTRALLPQLRQSATHGPVMVQFVGSITADIFPPRLAVYAASKAFLRTLSRSLENDEKVWGAPTGVKFAYLIVGEVQTNGQPCEETIMSPSADTFAKALVAKVGCGRKAYAPYMPHALGQWVLSILPEGIADSFVADNMTRALALHKKSI